MDFMKKEKELMRLRDFFGVSGVWRGWILWMIYTKRKITIYAKVDFCGKVFVETDKEIEGFLWKNIVFFASVGFFCVR